MLAHVDMTDESQNISNSDFTAVRRCGDVACDAIGSYPSAVPSRGGFLLRLDVSSGAALVDFSQRERLVVSAAGSSGRPFFPLFVQFEVGELQPPSSVVSKNSVAAGRFSLPTRNPGRTPSGLSEGLVPSPVKAADAPIHAGGIRPGGLPERVSLRPRRQSPLFAPQQPTGLALE